MANGDSQHPQLLSVQKAAAFLGISVKTIRLWAQSGKLKGIKVGSRGDWRFTKEELTKMIRVEKKKFAKIKKFLKDNAEEIQKISSQKHIEYLGKDNVRLKNLDRNKKDYISIVKEFAENLENLKKGTIVFERLAVKIAKKSLRNELTLEEAVDGTIFLKQAFWEKLDREGLLNDLTTQDFYSFSHTITTYTDIVASKIAFAFHDYYKEEKEKLEKVQSKLAQQEKELKILKGSKLRVKLQGHDFFAGGGAMGKIMRSMNWSKSVFGPVEEWPQSLRSAVSISLGSAFPIAIYWGKELALLYNDAWSPIPGNKHPWALGKPGRKVWPEIWDAIGPLFDKVKKTGEGVWQQDQLLLMNRHGYTEECYFNFTFSPIRSEVGVEGIFNAVVETTNRVIGERRLNTLRDLGAKVAIAKSIEEACKISAETLGNNTYDIPFSLMYLIAPEGEEAYLAATSNIEPGTEPAPQKIQLTNNSNKTWPLKKVYQTGKTRIIHDLKALFRTLPGGAWPESPGTAVILPLAASGQNHLAGFLILGVSPRRALDNEYLDFFNLAANHVTTAIANAHAFEEERKRAEALAEIDRAKTTFFSNVSHEFRTPLTLMLGPIEEMLNQKNTLSKEQKERTEILHRNALRLLRLVNTLLDFSRIEAGRVQAVFEATDISAYTADLASNFRSAVEKAGLKFVVETSSLKEDVYVDREMLEKIVLNLLSNAFKYTLKGRIKVTMKETKDAVELSVADTGVGIPKEELPFMFERFHRVTGTEGRTHEGTGIGLSLVQELVKLHKGTIAVKSIEGKGSTFTVSLQKGVSHLPKDRISGKRNIASTALRTTAYVEEAMRWLPGHEEITEVISDMPIESSAAFPDVKHTTDERNQKARILLADDNTDMRQYITRLLSQKYEVITVPDGKTALSVIKKQIPDLVLTDVMMPKLDGFGLIKALRENKATATLPLIMLSARAGEEASIEGMEAGADDYLVKPFSARELLARVGAHLEMARIRKEATQAVVASKERLNRVLETDAVGVLFFDYSGTVVGANGVFLQMTGYTGEQIKRRELHWRKMTPPEWIVESERQMKQFERTGRVGPYEKEYFLADGSRRWMHFAGRDLGDGTIVEFCIDISERKHAEEALRKTQLRYDKLFNSNTIGIFLPGFDGYVRESNDIFLQMIGYTRKDMQDGKVRWDKMTPHEFKKTDDEKVQELITTGEATPWEKEYIRKDGTRLPILLGVVVIEKTANEGLAFAIDITERKKLERQKDDFMGIASHELKTPVTSVKAYTQVLHHLFTKKGDTRSAELLAKMDSQLNKLTSLIADLLDVTKIQAGKLQFNETYFDFNELVNEIVEEIQRTTNKHTLLIDAAKTKSIFGDRDRVGQVLTNFLTNAIKYSPHANKIIIKTKADKETVTLSVQDYGLGISKDKQDKVFERFYRVSGDKEETIPGIGLGLYISSEIIKRQGGKIWVESTVGKGSTFYFQLPVVKKKIKQEINSNADEEVKHE